MVDQGFTEFYMEVMPLESSLHSYLLIPFSNNTTVMDAQNHDFYKGVTSAN
jgi:hypothetical protein